jgi:AbrB family looped-hinge helix DNA binding protein
MASIITTVSSKGQIVIPAGLREQLGIKAGTKLAMHQQDGCLVVQPITREFVRSLRGAGKGDTSLVEARERDHWSED